VSTRRSSGFTTWKPDSINIGIARAAVANFDGQRFELLWATHWLVNLRMLCGGRWFLDAKQLALARQLRIITRLPHMTDDEIDDLNKGDAFVRLLAVCQISWLCIQLIIRLSRKLPTTQIEVVTLAFAVSSIITHGLFYSRPKDVQTVREVKAIRYPTPAELTQIAAAGPRYLFHGYPYFTELRDGISIPNNASHQIGDPHIDPSHIERPIIAIGLVVFGGLHLLAWNYEFPSQIERTLWQASAVVTMVVFPLVFLVDWLRPCNFLRVTLEFGYPIVFIAARAIIMVEIVRSLAFQPPETFRTTWTANVPHVG
jgi:hypothetical protein